MIANKAIMSNISCFLAAHHLVHAAYMVVGVQAMQPVQEPVVTAESGLTQPTEVI